MHVTSIIATLPFPQVHPRSTRQSSCPSLPSQETNVHTPVMNQVSVDDAKTHLSRLVDRVTEGEEFVLVKEGRPVARLIRYASETKDRLPGSARGEVTMSADFDARLPIGIRESFE